MGANVHNSVCLQLHGRCVRDVLFMDVLFVCFTHFMPLRCMIHSTMVAFTQNRMKKSTVSARNLCRGEGMVYSRPTFGGEKNSKFDHLNVRV